MHFCISLTHPLFVWAQYHNAKICGNFWSRGKNTQTGGGICPKPLKDTSMSQWKICLGTNRCCIRKLFRTFRKSGRQLREREGGWGVFDHALRIRKSEWEIAGDKVVFMVLWEEEGVCFISGLRALSARGCTAVTALQSDGRRRRRSQPKYYQSRKDKPWSNYVHKATAMTDHCRYPLC